MLGISKSHKRNDSLYPKKFASDDGKNHCSSTGYSPRYSPAPGGDKKQAPQAGGRSNEDMLSTLKKYGKAKVLCFKCGEKWNTSPQMPQCFSG